MTIRAQKKETPLYIICYKQTLQNIQKPLPTAFQFFTQKNVNEIDCFTTASREPSSSKNKQNRYTQDTQIKPTQRQFQQ